MKDGNSNQILEIQDIDEPIRQFILNIHFIEGIETAGSCSGHAQDGKARGYIAFRETNHPNLRKILDFLRIYGLMVRWDSDMCWWWADIILEKGDRISVLEAYGRDGIAILPFGSVNMITGANRTLNNIYQTWEDMTVEFWKVREGKIVLIFTSGRRPLFKVGDKKHFSHDQTQRPLFEGAFIELLDFCLIEDLATKGPQVVGKKSVMGYVYK